MDSDDGRADDLEREKWAKDIFFREREVALKEGELELKRNEARRARWFNPVVMPVVGAILVAAVAGLANAGVSLMNGDAQRQLEDRKAEQARILEMIKTGSDTEKAAENLAFLLDAGLISEPALHDRMRVFLANRKPGSGPVLPASSGAGVRDDSIPVSALPRDHPLRTAARAVGQLRTTSQNSTRPVCTAFLVMQDLVMTAKDCINGATPTKLALMDGVVESIYDVEWPPVENAGSSSTANYALLRVQGDPGKRFGTLTLGAGPPALAAELAIVSFRTDSEQRVEERSPDCRVVQVQAEHFSYRCDTRSGSSGAPILSSDGRSVLGVHFARTQDDIGLASRADMIVKKSQVLGSR